jgi:hypothetical protein
MKSSSCFCILLFLAPWSLFGADSIYCPEHSAYINVGMTIEQVVSACGQPLNQQDSNEPLTRRVEVLQLIYDNIGIKSPLSVTGFPSAVSGSELKSGWEGGAQLEVNVIDNKVKEIKINGSGAGNAASVCPDGNFKIDDNVSTVYYACGSPSIVNNTFIKQVIPTTEKPRIWTYQTNQFTPPFSLTFVNGKLQSINQ